jgi:large subunit ribosomal protein L19
MALKATHKNTDFGVGDTIRVIQNIVEEGKKRKQTFEGIVIGIKGKGSGKTFTVRRMGTQQIGIERIYPLASPTLEKISVTKKGVRGIRRSKLYFIRKKSRKEIEKIYSRASKRQSKKKS